MADGTYRGRRLLSRAAHGRTKGKAKAMKPVSQIYRETTDRYLDGINQASGPIDPERIMEDILGVLVRDIREENLGRAKDEKIKIPLDLPPEVVAHVLLRLHPIVKLSLTPRGEEDDRAKMPLAMYMEDGPDEGLYVVDDDAIGALARRYNFRLLSKEIKDVLYQLSLEASVRYLTDDRDLIAVNNGIFDYKSKTLLPFGPDRVFISKSQVDYNPSARNPVITNPDGTPWDVDSWMDSLTDDPALRHLLWQIVGAVIRPNVSWDKALILYATKGNNGKGTLCVLLRNLCGPGTYTSIPLTNMGKDFMLESLVHARAIITDENRVGGFLDDCANFKSLVTGDPVQINRKNKSAITVKFRGLVVECMNDMPKVKDKSDSFGRRLLIVPFEKRFEGCENKAIKHDYLNRRDVLEYVLHKVLNTDYYEFDEPRACQEMLGEFKVDNDPVRQFLEEILPKARWDALPYDFLWDLYTRWFRRDTPTGTMIGRNSFIDRVAETVETTPEWGWTAPDRKNPFRVRRGWMECYEPMLEKYGLTEKWGADLNGRAVPNPHMVSVGYTATPGNRFLQKLVRGLVRMSDEQVDAAMDVQAEQVLADFAAWFWDDPAGGLAWYVAGLGLDAAGAARMLATSKEDMCRAMDVRRDFPRHRVLDRRYKVSELAAAAQDYWLGTHGTDPTAMRGRAQETLDAFADWFWHNGVVEYYVNGTVILAPEDARSYTEDMAVLVMALDAAIARYQDKDTVRTLCTTDELLAHLKAYWYAHYDGTAGEAQ